MNQAGFVLQTGKEGGFSGRNFALVVLAALLVRLGFVFLAVFPIAWDSPGVAHGSELGMIARNWAEGLGFSSPFGRGEQPTAWLGPLVPALWALIFGWWGPFTQASLTAVYVSQVLASAIACGVYYSIACHLAARLPGLPRRAPLLLALVVCVWPSLWLDLERPWYLAFQELGVALLFFVAIRFLDRPRPSRAMVLGFVAGIQALINPVPLALFGWVLAVAWWTAGNQRRAVLKSGALAVLVTVLVLSPWLIRNASVFGRPVFLRSNFGLELYQGNHAEGTVQQSRDSRHPALHEGERRLYDELGEIEYVHRRGQEALAYMRTNPGVTAKRTLQRIYLFWCTDLWDHWPWSGDPELRAPQESQASQADQASGLTANARWIVKALLVLAPLALALVALLRGFLGRVPYRSLFLGVFVLLPLPYYITHVSDSYGVIVRPWLLLFGGLYVLVSRLRVETGDQA